MGTRHLVAALLLLPSSTLLGQNPAVSPGAASPSVEAGRLGTGRLANPSTSGPRGAATIDPLSPETLTYDPADVGNADERCAVGILWTRDELGVPPGGNIDAISDFRDVVPAFGPASYNWPPQGVQSTRDVIMSFSVDRATEGLLRVRGEALTDGAASDIFSLVLTPKPQIAFVLSDAECVTSAPALQTDIDGIVRSKTTIYPFYYSVDPPTAGAMGVSPADILMVPFPGAPPVVILTESDLGLVPGDDVNALAMGTEGMVFSLSPSSPTAAASPLVGSGGLFARGAVPWAFAPQCNLLPTDDLNAVAIGDPERQHDGGLDSSKGTMCADPATGATDETSLWRVFDLRSHENDYHVTNVEVGAGLVDLFDFLVDVRLYTSTTDDPAGIKTLVESSSILYPAGTPPGTLFHHPFPDVNCGRDFLWVELHIPASPGFPLSGGFRWAATRFETAATYMSSPNCGPGLTDLDLLGFSDHALFMTLSGYSDHGIQLVHGEVVGGQTTDVFIVDLNPFELATVYFTLDGLGTGPCPPQFGGLCIDLNNPLVLGQPIAGPGGIGQVPMPVTPQLAGQQLALQSLVQRGPGGLDSASSNATLTEVK